MTNTINQQLHELLLDHSAAIVEDKEDYCVSLEKRIGTVFDTLAAINLVTALNLLESNSKLREIVNMRPNSPTESSEDDFHPNAKTPPHVLYQRSSPKQEVSAQTFKLNLPRVSGCWYGLQ